MAIGIAGAVILVNNFGRIAEYIPISNTNHIGRVGAITLNQLPLDIQQKVSRGLTRINQDGEVVADIAQTMTVSEDETEYTFSLDPNTYWSNGARLLSSEIDLALKDVEVIRDSDESIVFKLKEPFAPFPAVVSQPLLKRVTETGLVKKSQVIGVGDYSITGITYQGQNLKTVTLVGPEETLVYHFFATEEEAITSFKLGHVDSIEALTAPYLKDWPNVTIEKSEVSNRYLALFFNTANPALQDKTIRQLLSYATPKGEGERVISPISSRSWVYNPQVKPYDYNLETARASLNKLKEANPNLALSFELTTTPAYVDMAQEIIESWKELGIEVKLKIVSFPDANDYQVLLIGQQVADDPDQYALWHSTQSTNITNYQNPKIDKLLEDGRKERDKQQRKQIYQDFQRFLVEDSPAAFLHQLHTYNLKRR